MKQRRNRKGIRSGVVEEAEEEEEEGGEEEGDAE